MKYCPKCGREIREDWRICPYCGYDLSPPPITKPRVEYSEPQYDRMYYPPTTSIADYNLKNKSRKGLGGIIAFIIFLIVVVPLMLWYIFPTVGINITTGSIEVIYHSIWHNNVKFYIDGECKGEYPSDTWITFNGISPGTHTVRATTVDGIYLDEKTVEVHAGETVRVELSYLGDILW